jgi:hypothetical protein
MATISLESAIRTCKVDTAYANKVQSDRFFNPTLMMCPVWNGVDTTGREVCFDSYYTKNAGCNSANDRVMVENDVTRPQYMEYINLSAQGINGAVYGNSMPYNQVGQTNKELSAINNVTGNFGLQFGANTYPGCNYYPYEQALSQVKDAASPPETPVNVNPANAQQMNAHQMNAQQMNAHQMKAQQMNSQQMKAQQMNRMHPVAQQKPSHMQQPQMQREHFQNLASNPVNNTSSQRFAQNQQNLRQQQFLNQGFQGNNFRRQSGN